MNLLQFDSESAWVNGVASFWRDRLRLNPRQRLCLPTGHTPNPIYAAMVQSVQHRQISFGQAVVFALDEFGGLTRDDPGRCKNMLRQHLVDHVDLPEGRFHTLDPDASNLEQECQKYEADIGEGFDLVLLGIGLNGHLGLNEPGSSIDSGVRRVELHAATIDATARYLTHRQLPRWGLTVGLKQILAAKEVWLLANGRSKAEIIRRTIRGEIDLAVPASLLRRHPNSFLFLDPGAVSSL
jgi:glucosamine-6-phosphate isomerase